MDSKKDIWAWSFYDWANSAFATTVIAGFFPVFYKSYWAAQFSSEQSTLHIGLANSISAIFIALLAPVLGAIADRVQGKKRFLTFFMITGSLSSMLLYFVSSEIWVSALLLFVLGNIGFSGGNIFYDALLPSVASAQKIDYVSSLGFALGYIGGGLLFLVNVLMANQFQWFGFQSTVEGVRTSFLSVGIWWLLFTLPLLFLVKEPKKEGKIGPIEAVKQGVMQLKKTFEQIRKLKMVITFLLAYWLYIDGVDTIIRMAVDYGISLNFPSSSLIIALLIVQFIAFPSALIYNMFAKKIGIKNALYVGIIAYIIITIFGVFMQNVSHFYILAACVGLFQGGIQALSRSYYTRLIPVDKSAEFFGFYNMLSKTAAIIGPALVGIVTVVTKNNRIGILSLLVFFIVGGLLLRKVDLKEGQELRKELDQG